MDAQHGGRDAASARRMVPGLPGDSLVDRAATAKGLALADHAIRQLTSRPRRSAGWGRDGAGCATCRARPRRPGGVQVLGGMVAVLCPSELDPWMQKAAVCGIQRPALADRARRMGPLVRDLRRNTDPLFRPAGSAWTTRDDPHGAAPGGVEREMTRSNTLAVARAKCSVRDRRNRAIVKRLAAGASTRAVGAEFGLTAKRCAGH